MKVRASQNQGNRNITTTIVRRKGVVYVINRKNPKLKQNVN